MQVDQTVIIQVGNGPRERAEADKSAAVLEAQGYKRRDARGFHPNPEWPFFWAILFERQLPTLREVVKMFLDDETNYYGLKLHREGIQAAYDREMSDVEKGE